MYQELRKAEEELRTYHEAYLRVTADEKQEVVYKFIPRKELPKE